ncbi:MAG: DUF1232 domain-containing protein [Chloroflexales bacterium]|nr:DUF1232 domain-containing protein [Chloroflexales bacterium]
MPEPETRHPAPRPAGEVVQRTTAGKVAAALAVFLGVAYIINPTAGVFELIPDVPPITGNLDEAAATGLIIWDLSYDIFRAQQPDRER